MDLLEYLKMSLLKFNFVMICIIHKMLALFKDHLNYLKDKDTILECFFKEYSRHLFFLINFFILLFIIFSLTFFITYNDGKYKS